VNQRQQLYLATARESAVISAAPIKSAAITTVEADIASISIAARYDWVSAEDPCAAEPDVAVTGAGRNIGSYDWAAYDPDAKAFANDGAIVAAVVIPKKSTIIAAGISVIVSTRGGSAKFLGVCVRRACSKQPSNKSRSEHEITHHVTHGNLPSVRGRRAYLPAYCELFSGNLYPAVTLQLAFHVRCKHAHLQRLRRLCITRKK
jgi:hypothetical protein